MQHFYDAQIRRYITQLTRLFSNFSYKDGKGNLTQIPVMYGDITRQVGHIIRDNSENKIPSAPRISIYITTLEMDRQRTFDSSFVGKIHLRERAYDSTGKEYLNTQGQNYTVERLAPTPFTLGINCDIWSTNTEQKLQIVEQILTLFNPSLEIQTTDNYVDWTSLSVVNLDNIQFSTRSIPIGTESEIDVGQLGFTTPIWLSPPAKVKKLGVITSVVMSIFDETRGTIDLGQSVPELKAYDDSPSQDVKAEDPSLANVSTDDPQLADKSKASVSSRQGATSLEVVTAAGYDIIVTNNIVVLGKNGVAGEINWRTVLESELGEYIAGLSKIYLNRLDVGNVIGTFALNSLDETQIIVNWDVDTIPTNSIFEGPAVTKGTIDYIIDPTRTNPTNLKVSGTRILLLEDIGASTNADGPDAWKSVAGVDFIASANDIVEWDGNSWTIVFNASNNDGSDSTIDIKYTTNLNTGIQYRWDGSEWTLSFEGTYRIGTWRLAL